MFLCLRQVIFEIQLLIHTPPLLWKTSESFPLFSFLRRTQWVTLVQNWFSGSLQTCLLLTLNVNNGPALAFSQHTTLASARQRAEHYCFCTHGKTDRLTKGHDVLLWADARWKTGRSFSEPSISDGWSTIKLTRMKALLATEKSRVTTDRHQVI